MGDRSEIELAQEDERVCDHLCGIDAHRWVVISAFYSALRYINHYIFPFGVQKSEDVQDPDLPDEVDAHDVEEYLDLTGDDHSRHGARVLLLRVKLKEAGQTSRIARKYAKLMSASETARYSKQAMSKRDADDAKARLREIKEFCAPELTQGGTDAAPEAEPA